MHGQIRRVLVAGHLWLDAPLQELSHTHDDQHAIIRDATLTAFEYLFESALEQSVDALILHGVLFSSQPTLRACATFRDGIQALLEEGVEVLWAVQKPQERQLLEELQCLPRGLNLLTSKTQHKTLFGGQEHATSDWGLVSCDLVDQQSFPLKDWAWTEEQTWLRIGLTQKAIGHLTSGAVLHDQQDRHFQVILSGQPERSHTTRSQHTIYHAPGCVQGLNAQRTGPCSATLLKIDEQGEVELLTLETSAVRREQLDLVVDAKSTEVDFFELAELEWLELNSQLKGSPVKLLQIHWQIRGSVEQVKSWSSGELLAQLGGLFNKTDRNVPVLHTVQLVPLMSGQVINSQEFLNEQLEEQFLQQLSGQLSGLNQPGGVERVIEQLIPASAAERASFPWKTLITETQQKLVNDRAAEFGVRALQETSRAG